MPRYRVEFKLGERIHTCKLPRDMGIADVREGFWVRMDYEKERLVITRGNRCMWWIPPGQVRFVEKLVEQRDDDAG